MRETKELFLKVIRCLHEHGALEHIILIGSWCQYYYQYYFNEEQPVPVIRTFDVDFLIPNPPRIHKEVDVSQLLEELGFNRHVRMLDGYSKFIHPNLEVEFLIPELGRGKNEPYDIPKLHIDAVGLRYLHLLQSQTISVEHDGITVRLPEPAAFVLHKFIISEKRKNLIKKEKDQVTARDMSRFLLTIPEQRERLKTIFDDFPKKWKKQLLSVVQEKAPDLHEFLLEKP